MKVIANTLSLQDIRLAYRKFKSFVYYDKPDLFLRRRLAEFECAPDFDARLESLLKVVTSNRTGYRKFESWLKEISYRTVPKRIEKANVESADDGNFLSNVTSAKAYTVEKVNYFFDGPIELHLIAVLWIMVEGWRLDAQLGKECYGSRLDERVGQPNDQSLHLFRKYHELYARWRDAGIRKAKQLLTEEQESVSILGLDLQEYYYRIRADFSEIAQSVQEAVHAEEDMDNNQPDQAPSPSNLLSYLEAICQTYREKISPHLKITHKDGVLPADAGIPIGLCTSPLIANWYLRNFDRAVMTKLRPAYYGRYVDDMLIVMSTPDDLTREKHPVSAFIKSTLVQTHILEEPKDNRYEMVSPRGLYLQQKKCILQYFDVKHSIAGLEKFQKKLEENGSDFLLLPVDEADNSLEEVAYDLLYEGSVNKFRNVKGLVENRYELAKHLARQTIFHLLTDDAPDPKISLGLRRFFKGRSAIEFHDLWERVFTFFLIANDIKAATAFAKQLRGEIKRVRFLNDQSITSQLVGNLEAHLDLSQAMAEALGDTKDTEGTQTAPSELFRQANLIRHHFVRVPLLNYTDYSGSLTVRRPLTPVNIDPRKLEFSPRYLPFHECMLLAKSGDVALGTKTAFEWTDNIFKEVNGYEAIGWSIELNRNEGTDVELF